MKEALTKIPYLMIFILFGLYLGYDYYSFQTSEQSPYLQKKSEIEAAKRETIQLQAKVKQNLEFSKTLEAKRTQLREIALRLDEMKATLSEDMDVAGFIKMVVTEAKKVGITVQSLKPTSSNPKEFYIEQNFSLTFRGVYVQLIVFLERLANIQKIVRVDNFEMHPSGARPGSQYVELEGTIELKTYRYLASKADEIAKNGGSVSPSAVAAANASGVTTPKTEGQNQ